MTARRWLGTAGFCLATMPGLAAAGPAWQDNSLTYVGGGHFRVDPETRQTVTFEHASGWGFGDLFVFVDATRFNGRADNGWYGEISPRFSYAKLTRVRQLHR